MEAVGPVDRVPRNEVAEKHNEIPGRQMAPEADPVVEIRSAVHSNYANMVAMLAADNKVYLARRNAIPLPQASREAMTTGTALYAL